ncbi:MAG TPA: hypothetical protein VGH19_03535 [Verrucomicrobiae bacterium]
MTLKRILTAAMLCAAMVCSSNAVYAQGTVIDLKRDQELVVNQVIPVTMTGASGEIASTLKFDLEVLGCEFVSADRARFEVKVTQGDGLEGRLIHVGSKQQILGKRYAGSDQRRLAHAFADEIVQSIRGVSGVGQTRIAFKGEQRQGYSEIFVADYDGANAVPLTSDNSLVAAPSWVKANGAIYYTSYKLGTPKIFAHNLSTGERKIASGQPGLNTSVAISPDGSKIAMVLSKNGSPDIYVANADGSGLVQLTKTTEDESSPCWSPDGKTICFYSRMGRGLYTVPASGGAMKRLTTAGVSNATEPDWSPDGKTIVFTSLMGDFNICTVPATGGSATVLATGEDPSWAPNSRTVIFARRVGGRRVLSLLDVPTKRVKDIKQTAGSSSQPVWAR